MALHWDATKTGWAKLEQERKEELRPVLDNLIWATLAVGWGEITEAGKEEWLERYVTIYTAYGEKREWMAHVVTNIDLFVGLNTNVFPKESNAKFRKKVAELYAENARSLIENVRVAEAEAA